MGLGSYEPGSEAKLQLEWNDEDDDGSLHLVYNS